MTDRHTTGRSLATFALLAYNQERFIREAIEGAFTQTYEPLEIILSDDCSSDRTFEIMQEMAAGYDGPHDVHLRRSPKNKGLAAHYNEVLKLASGRNIVIAAGDDISLPTRTELCARIFCKYSDVMFVETQETPLYENGMSANIGPAHDFSLLRSEVDITLFDLVKYMKGDVPPLAGSARAFRLAEMKKFPELNSNCPTEDSPSILRMLFVGKGCVAHTSGVVRRYHANNLSGSASINKMNFKLILDQYLEDVKSARRLGLISERQARKVLRWCVEKVSLREIKQSMAGTRGRRAKLLFELLTRRHLNIVARMRLLRSWAALWRRGGNSRPDEL